MAGPRVEEPEDRIIEGRLNPMKNDSSVEKED